MQDKLNWKPLWIVTKFENDVAFERGEHFERNVVEGNLALIEGIADVLDLLIGAGGTAFSNANARLGVGDSTTAAAATQTALQAATNKLYKAMEASYPQRSNQTITFRSIFASGEANFSWEEFSVMNGADETTAKNLNRKVTASGTKVSGQVWTLDLQLTLG